MAKFNPLKLPYRGYRYLRRRVIRAMSPTPLHEEKAMILKKIAKRYGLRTLIETGTYLGEMLESTKDYFDNIVSIEFDRKLFEEAQKKFARYPKIRIVHGDSGEKLPEIVANIKEPALFWLDAHYSGNGTGKSLLETPIIKELDTIFLNKSGKNVILIDDARCFDGTHDYPTIQEINEKINGYGGYSLSVKRDIIRIEPLKIK